jgi:hypothetical protein
VHFRYRPFKPTPREPMFAPENVGPVGPFSYVAWCPRCLTNTSHANFTDEHGCERGFGCRACRWIAHPSPCSFVKEDPRV